MNSNDWKIVVLARNVFELRDGPRSLVLEAEFYRNNFVFRTLEIPTEWSNDNGTPVSVSSNDLVAIKEVFHKYFSTHPIRRLAGEKCVFLEPGQELPPYEGSGIRFLNWIRRIR